MKSLSALRKNFIKENYPYIDEESISKASFSLFMELLKDEQLSFNDVIDEALKDASYLSFGPSMVLDMLVTYTYDLTEENKSKILNFLEDYTNKGSKRASLTLGKAYLYGSIVKQNIDKAKHYINPTLNKFTDSGKVLSEYYFKNGDSDEALKYALKSSNLGDSSSSYNIGLHYVSKEDYLNSKKYFELAIEQDPENYDVYYDLGRLYANGFGVKLDYDKAIELVKKSYDNSQRKVMKNYAFELLGIIYSNKAFYEYEAGNLETAFINYSIAANSYNDAFSMYKLAKMYFNGEYVEKDDNKVIELYKRSANLGYVESEFWLGSRYYSGKGIEKDNELAVKFISAAANQNYPEALIFMSFFHSEGFHTLEKNHKKAREYMFKAKELNNPMAIDYWNKLYKDNK